MCAVHGQGAKDFLELERRNHPDLWLYDFIEKYGDQFLTLTPAQLDTVPYDALKHFFLSVFSEPHKIAADHFTRTTQANRAFYQGKYDEELKRLHPYDSKTPFIPVPLSDAAAEAMCLRFFLKEKVTSYNPDFLKYREDLDQRCTTAALAFMGRDTTGVVYGRPLESTDTRKTAYPITDAFDCEIKYDSDDMFRHTYIVGKTGSGKTTLLKTLISQHINKGQGVIVLSPESDIFDEILDCIPPDRAADVIYYDPTAPEPPTVSINPFTLEKGEYVSERAGEVYATLEAAFGDLGESMKTLLTKCTYTLLQIPGANLQDLKKLLNNSPDYRNAVITNKNIDQDTREWWRDTYHAKGNQYAKSAEAIVRRLEAFTMPPLSSTLASASFSFSDALNAKKSIFLFNLSRLKGLQAEVTGQLLSSMVLQTLLARDAQNPKDRLTYQFLIDEFQTYAGGNDKTFIEIFNRARKYKMSITLAHQITANIKPALLSTILGNSGTKIIMERPSEDAPMFAKELQIRDIDPDAGMDDRSRSTFNAAILQNLAPHEFFLSTPKNKKGAILRTMFENYKPVSLPIPIQDNGRIVATVHTLEEWRSYIKSYSRSTYGRHVTEGADIPKPQEATKPARAARNPQPPPANEDDPEGRFFID